jgi:hypothetical protein
LGDAENKPLPLAGPPAVRARKKRLVLKFDEGLEWGVPDPKLIEQRRASEDEKDEAAKDELMFGEAEDEREYYEPDVYLDLEKPPEPEPPSVVMMTSEEVKQQQDRVEKLSTLVVLAETRNHKTMAAADSIAAQLHKMRSHIQDCRVSVLQNKPGYGGYGIPALVKIAQRLLKDDVLPSLEPLKQGRLPELRLAVVDTLTEMVGLVEKLNQQSETMDALLQDKMNKSEIGSEKDDEDEESPAEESKATPPVSPRNNNGQPPLTPSENVFRRMMRWISSASTETPPPLRHGSVAELTPPPRGGHGRSTSVGNGAQFFDLLFPMRSQEPRASPSNDDESAQRSNPPSHSGTVIRADKRDVKTTEKRSSQIRAWQHPPSPFASQPPNSAAKPPLNPSSKPKPPQINTSKSPQVSQIREGTTPSIPPSPVVSANQDLYSGESYVSESYVSSSAASSNPFDAPAANPFDQPASNPFDSRNPFESPASASPSTASHRRSASTSPFGGAHNRAASANSAMPLAKSKNPFGEPAVAKNPFGESSMDGID